MIEIITNSKLITKYQRLFIKQLKIVCNTKVISNVGYQGYNEESTLYYSEKSNFWFTSVEARNRYWNAFGFDRPQNGQSNSITVEINFPYKGINRSIGGIFGQNERGEILILHRGRIGGGKPGVGKELFIKNYRENPVIANDDGIEKEFCIVTSLDSKYLDQEVGNFVREVRRIKVLTLEQIPDVSLLHNFVFNPEATGSSKVNRSGTSNILRTHGIVVSTLAEILEGRGHKVANDRNIDLFIHKKEQIKAIFEFKRSSLPRDLYSSIGQLIIYSIPIKTGTDLIIVLPDQLNKSIEMRLKELRIKILYYQWNDGTPLFPNLDKVL